jgi:hypothetical protein
LSPLGCALFVGGIAPPDGAVLARQGFVQHFEFSFETVKSRCTGNDGATGSERLKSGADRACISDCQHVDICHPGPSFRVPENVNTPFVPSCDGSCE